MPMIIKVTINNEDVCTNLAKFPKSVRGKVVNAALKNYLKDEVSRRVLELFEDEIEMTNDGKREDRRIPPKQTPRAAPSVPKAPSPVPPAAPHVTSTVTAGKPMELEEMLEGATGTTGDGQETSLPATGEQGAVKPRQSQKQIKHKLLGEF